MLTRPAKSDITEPLDALESNEAPYYVKLILKFNLVLVFMFLIGWLRRSTSPTTCC